MKLDYTIYGADRAAYLSLSPTQLDKLAFYILYNFSRKEAPSL